MTIYICRLVLVWSRSNETGMHIHWTCKSGNEMIGNELVGRYKKEEPC